MAIQGRFFGESEFLVSFEDQKMCINGEQGMQCWVLRYFAKKVQNSSDV